MSLKTWEKKVLKQPGAAERVDELEHKLLVAQGMAAARKKARVSQTKLAQQRLGVSQPRMPLVTNPDGDLHVLGPVRREFGKPLPATQGDFAWQWVTLPFGQTLLIKRRNQLRVVHQVGWAIGNTRSTSERPSPEASVTLLDRANDAEDRDAAHPLPARAGERRPADTRVEQRPSRPLDLDRVISYLYREELSDKAIGYAVRRVAQEGTPEQVVAFLPCYSTSFVEDHASARRLTPRS